LLLLNLDDKKDLFYTQTNNQTNKEQEQAQEAQEQEALDIH
jgi:hypothetical protein